MQKIKKPLIVVFCILPALAMALTSLVFLGFLLLDLHHALENITMAFFVTISCISVAGLIFGTFVDENKWLNYPKILTLFRICGTLCLFLDIVLIFVGLFSKEFNASNSKYFLISLIGPVILGLVYLNQAKKLSRVKK